MHPAPIAAPAMAWAPTAAPAPAAMPAPTAMPTAAPPDLIDLSGSDRLFQGGAGKREGGRRAQRKREHRGAGGCSYRIAGESSKRHLLLLVAPRRPFKARTG